MRVTQGTFSFLPDLTDEQIAAQIRYAWNRDGRCRSSTPTIPHPRNAYWEMWGMPLFDLTVDDANVVLREVRACREAHPQHYSSCSPTTRRADARRRR